MKERLDTFLNIRCKKTEMKIWEFAANKNKKKRSDWVRRVLNQAAEKEKLRFR